MGGALYTWGGDFSWVEPCAARGPGPAKRDHHKGCLGHGDTEGRLVPTPVAGELQVRGRGALCAWCVVQRNEQGSREVCGCCVKGPACSGLAVVGCPCLGGAGGLAGRCALPGAAPPPLCPTTALFSPCQVVPTAPSCVHQCPPAPQHLSHAASLTTLRRALRCGRWRVGCTSLWLSPWTGACCRWAPQGRGRPVRSTTPGRRRGCPYRWGAAGVV